jgi:pilus assembly protein Flp/PilA
MTKFYVMLQAMLAEKEEGQGLAEYGLILAGVAVLAIASLAVLSGNINGLLEGISFS